MQFLRCSTFFFSLLLAMALAAAADPGLPAAGGHRVGHQGVEPPDRQVAAGGGARASRPVAPGNLQGSALSSSEVALSWTDQSSNETGFEVERSDDSGASFQNVATLAAGTETYTDAGLVAGTELRYRVRAVGPGSFSGWAGPVTVSTLPDGGGGGGGGAGTVQTYAPTADAYVRSNRATSNFGSDTVLQARAGQIVSFLAFEIDAGTVESAVLRLTSNAFTQIATQVAVTDPPEAAWGETTITWNDQPAIGAVLGSLPATDPPETVELDVTLAAASAASAGGRFTLALLGTGTGQSFFVSRDGALGQPELEVTYQDDGEPPPPEPMPHLEVGPSPAMILEAGDTVQLSATWFDADGNPAPLPPGAQLAWTSSNPERVSIDANGFATVHQDDSFALLMVAAEGAEAHVPGVASVAVGAVLNPALQQLDGSWVLDVAVDPDESLASGYLSLTVARVPATETLTVGDLVTFGAVASISVESVEVQPDRLILRGSAPPIDSVYEELNVDLDAVALDRVAGVYADAGFPPLDGTPFETDPEAASAAAGGPPSASGLEILSASAAPDPPSPCRFSLNVSLNPDVEFKMEVRDNTLKQLSVLISGLLSVGMPEVRARTQLKCMLDTRVRMAAVPFSGVTFSVWGFIRPGVDFSLDFGQETETAEVGGPTFNISSTLSGGFDWDETDGLQFPGGFSEPDLSGSAAKMYLDGLQAATMTFSTAAFVEAGFTLGILPSIAVLAGGGPELSLVDFDLVVHRFSLRNETSLLAAVTLGPQDPDYQPPSFTDTFLWDFFPLKAIRSGELTERIVNLFGGNFLGGPFLELAPLNVLTAVDPLDPPQLELTANPVWIGGTLPYAPSTLIGNAIDDDRLGMLFRPSLSRQIWLRGPGDAEFFQLPGSPPEFIPAPGDEGDWQVRALDWRTVVLPFPLASPIETLKVEKAPPVLITPIGPELIVTLGEVDALDLTAVNPSSSEQTYTLTNDTAAGWLSVDPEGPITLAPSGGLNGHELIVDCTSGQVAPSSWIDLTLSVTGDETEYVYPVFVGCENFSIEPEVIVLKGSVASPPVPIQGELTILNRTDTEILWSTAVEEGAPLSFSPTAGFLAGGSDQIVTVESSCTVGGKTSYFFEITTSGDQREVEVVLDCADTGGNSWGDPHLVTHDGVHYDFQAVGEMVLSRAPAGGFEVQVRQAGNSDGRVSYNKAVALRVGSDRVGFYVNPPAGGGTMMVNGDPVSLAKGETFDLPGGGRVSRAGSPYTVTWPASGSYVRVNVKGSYMNVRVHADAALAGTLEGLMGDFDGDAGNDFQLRDGTPFPSPPSFAQLYDCSVGRCFAYDDPAGWIIRDAAESLFDYDFGFGPLDYAPEEGSLYPIAETDLGDYDPELVAWAQSLCVAAGITEPALVEACILDIVVSGDVEMGLSAGDVEAGQGPEPGPEVCDGFDNDLNGVIDDGDVCACFPGDTGLGEYLFCSTAVEWAVARTACLAQGRDLVKIHEAAENSALNAWMAANAAASRWIGLTDEGQEGNWIWADGSPAPFLNWGTGQPSGGAGENCVEHVLLDASWNDLPCSDTRGFICE